MNNLYDQKAKNIRKTWFLMTIFFLATIALGALLGYVFNSSVVVYGFALFGMISNITAYWFSDKIALSQSHAVLADRATYPELYTTIESLAKKAELPMPRVYIIEDPMPNAFATGRNPQNAAVAVTTGILPLLNKSELEGVLAHELSHIGNRDTLVMTMVTVLAGLFSSAAHFFAFGGSMGGSSENRNPLFIFLAIAASIIAPFAAMIVQLSISRKREFLADASGALLTKYPQGLASALQKISQFAQPMRHATESTAHLYIANPLGHAFSADGTEKVGLVKKLFMTHPPVQERVDALLGRTE